MRNYKCANIASTEGYKTLDGIYSQDSVQQCEQTNRRKRSKSVIFEIDIYPNSKEAKHAGGTANQPGLQRSYVARNSTVSRIGTNVSPEMSGQRKSLRRPILHNRTGIRTTNPAIGILFTDTDHLIVLCRSAITAIVIIATVSSIIYQHYSSTKYKLLLFGQPFINV
ncbi:MAG: hypothetical protein EZS28_042870 [Streblomastix strix]|uniref:Uncharacterized protein n=1 Tax=Streblomastix strix TaxID=222440 RepID=A0A5J4TTM8_9EUKA|nr:MAG: hypothetical protein EZS28_042870 [Streblomastix strix]